MNNIDEDYQLAQRGKQNFIEDPDQFSFTTRKVQGDVATTITRPTLTPPLVKTQILV